jgi:Tol biopolymer transport system component
MLATNPDVSPDGERIIFDNIGDKQEDLFIINRDGTGLRQLTNDAYKDRVPHWSPDGKQIAFFSDKTGKYEGWTINADGSNPRKVTDFTGTPENWAQLPFWSPDGKKLLFNVSPFSPIIFDTSTAWENQTPEKLPSPGEQSQWMLTFSWKTRYSNNTAVFEYSFATRQYKKLADFGVRPLWLADSRRLLFYDKDKIYLLDSQTKRIKEIMSVAPNRIQSIAVSKDNRTIYYSLQRTEADIWLGTFE